MKEEIIYYGYRGPEETIITKTIQRPGETMVATGIDIGPSQLLWNHSDEFNWGYCGSGPAQLALAILFDYTGDRRFAIAHHQEFKTDIVALWKDDQWQLEHKQIIEWMNEKGMFKTITIEVAKKKPWYSRLNIFGRK